MNSKIKHQTLYLFLLLITINLASAITLDELIASYDFNYNDGTVDVTAITHYGIDVDSNLLYDYLIIEITTDNLEAEYDFIGDLLLDNKLKSTTNNESYLPYGENTINLVYNPKLLTDGTYNLSLVINEDYFTHYRNLNAYSFYFDSSEYEQPDITLEIDSHNFVDNDSDTKYEYLDITVNINVGITDLYTIKAYIKDDENIVYSINNYSLTTGLNQIDISFKSSDIRTKRLDYANLYKIIIEDYEFLFNYTINYDIDDFDPEKTIFTSYFNDSKIDVDANNFSDILEIKVGVYANEDDNYDIELILYDGNNEFYDKIKEIFYLTSGENIIEIEINGTELYNYKVNGPLTISSIKIIKNNVTLDSLIQPYVTSMFYFSDFDMPLMPDLTFISFDSTESNISSVIKNIGAVHAYGIIVNYFDQNFTELYEETIIDLAINNEHEINFDYNSTNTTQIFAFIDYNNKIEESNESNNLFMLEISGTQIINIYLIQGWNLISVPFLLENKTLPEPFKTIEGNYTSVFAYDAKSKEWDLFDPTLPSFLNTLSIINETMGFWINMLEEDTLSMQGDIPDTTTFNIYEEWNLIGYPYDKEMDIQSTYENVNDSFSTIYMYNSSDSDQWKMYDIYAPSFLNDLYYAIPGFGYWVKALENSTWIFEGRFN